MKAYVFYARSDSYFVRDLSYSLGQLGIYFLLPAEGLSGGGQFWDDVRAAIIEADILLFIVHEPTLSSVWLHSELKFARRHNKHIITIAQDENTRQQLIPDTLQSLAKNAELTNALNHHSSLSYLNPISLEDLRDNLHYLSGISCVHLNFARIDSGVISDFAHLLREVAKKTEIHNLILNRALDWDKKGRNPDMLLRGTELNEAQRWIEASHDGTNPLTTLQIAYVNASQRRVRKNPVIRWFARMGLFREDKIFISYRRADSQNICRSIYDVLVEKFGEQSIFFDIDTLPHGADFAEYISDTLNKCSVFLTIIGDKWVNIRSEDGERRLDDENDWVRLEVQTALRNPNITVIPVLVSPAQIPSHHDLPESLQELSYRNAITIYDDHRFNKSLGKLIEAIEAAKSVP